MVIKSARDNCDLINFFVLQFPVFLRNQATWRKSGTDRQPGSFRCFSKLSREGGHLEGVSEGMAQSAETLIKTRQQPSNNNNNNNISFITRKIAFKYII